MSPGRHAAVHSYLAEFKWRDLIQQSEFFRRVEEVPV